MHHISSLLETKILNVTSFRFRIILLHMKKIEEIRSYIKLEMEYLNGCDEFLENTKEIDECNIDELAKQYRNLLVCFVITIIGYQH